jgi:type I restriction enzyme M protein
MLVKIYGCAPEGRHSPGVSLGAKKERFETADMDLTMNNKFCDLKALTNEATVEAWFVAPLLDDLGFDASDLKLKTSLREFKVGKGSKSALYKPDYVIQVDGIPTVVVDAKSPNEQIGDYGYQCSSYCLEINKGFDYHPVKFYLLTNGIKTALYQWDKASPLVELDFLDFVGGNAKFGELVALVGKPSLTKLAKSARTTIDNSPFKFAKIGLEDLGNRFQRIHQYIWSKEKKSPSAAFEELIKVVVVKLQKDKLLHRDGPNPKPAYKDVVFSIHWITGQTENDSPINDPLFRNLVQTLEADILQGKKKRFFDEHENINLSRDTIRWIVKELEHVDLVAMEDDVHGRMFETFLDATIRGRELGQFFTPRDVVDLMVGLADIKVSKTGVSTVLDACCGSGGFLIASMDRMHRILHSMVGLTDQERRRISLKIINEALFGIDAGSDPAIHRIARMNMYLHGDGGSHIYHADSLDKRVGQVGRRTNDNEY